MRLTDYMHMHSRHGKTQNKKLPLDTTREVRVVQVLNEVGHINCSLSVEVFSLY